MNKDDKKPSVYGLVSEYQKVPLFDPKDHSVSFAKDVFDRREKEILDCAKKAGFVRARLAASKTIWFVKLASK